MELAPVTVQTNTKVCEDLHIIQFTKPEGFMFVPGQFIVIEGTISGKPVRRSYSIASSPHDPYLEVAVSRQRPGTFSPLLCASKPGAVYHVLGPYGQFTISPGPVVLIGAGTGVTPYASHCRTNTGTEALRETMIITSQRTPERALYADVFRDSGATIHTTITRPEAARTPWEGHTGRIDETFLRSLDFPRDATYYVCGPTPMVVAVQEALTTLGIPRDRIKTEKYGKITA